MFSVLGGDDDSPIVYVIQEIPGTKAGTPKINIMSASKYGKFRYLLPEFSQIIFSPGPLIFKLRSLLKNYRLIVIVELSPTKFEKSVGSILKATSTKPFELLKLDSIVK